MDGNAARPFSSSKKSSSPRNTPRPARVEGAMNRKPMLLPAQAPALAVVLFGCSQSVTSPTNVADLDGMPSSMPPPPPGACREGPTEPQLCGFVSTMPLRDAFGASGPTQRGFGAPDAKPGDPPLARLASHRGPWVYEGLMTVPEAGRYTYRADGAAAATLYFDDPRHVARHQRGIASPSDPELEAGVHWFWLVADRPSSDLALFMRRQAPDAAEIRVLADARLAEASLPAP